MPDEIHASLGERYARAWCSGDPGQVAAFYASNGSLAINGGPPSVGRAAIAEAAGAFMEAFPDMQVAMEKLAQSGDRWEFHWKLTGTNTGPGGTGRKIQISGYESWKFGQDGELLESQGHFDEEDYRRQLHGVP